MSNLSGSFYGYCLKKKFWWHKADKKDDVLFQYTNGSYKCTSVHKMLLFWFLSENDVWQKVVWNIYISPAAKHTKTTYTMHNSAICLYKNKWFTDVTGCYQTACQWKILRRIDDKHVVFMWTKHILIIFNRHKQTISLK